LRQFFPLFYAKIFTKSTLTPVAQNDDGVKAGAATVGAAAATVGAGAATVGAGAEIVEEAGAAIAKVLSVAARNLRRPRVRRKWQFRTPGKSCRTGPSLSVTEKCALQK
jgi:hypothetical protein